MKNSANRLLQPVQWISPLAAILVAVSLCPAARAQLNIASTATFGDVGLRTQPPGMGPNDIGVTNTAGITVNETMINNGVFNNEANGFDTDTLPSGEPGNTFIVGGSSCGYIVTNLFVPLYPGGSDSGTWTVGDGSVYDAPNRPITVSQPWNVNFYQISGTANSSGLGSNATLIATYQTQAGMMTNAGDWLSFSNIQVFLAPNTTNAWTISITTNGAGYNTLALISNNPSTSPILANSRPIIIAGPQYVAVGGATALLTYGVTNGGSAWNVNGVPITNYANAFSLGIQTNFAPGLFSANPYSCFMISNILTGGTNNWTFNAAGSGSSVAPYGVNGYWEANYGAGYTRTLGSDAQAPVTTVTAVPGGAPGSVIKSSLTVKNITSADLGSYHFVITNSPNGTSLCYATSAVATITAVVPAANSFAAAVTNLGAVAYWPLDETVDPSTLHAWAYDIVGGHNGFYGVNANNGGGNAPDAYAPVAGPGNAGFAGLTAKGALSAGMYTNLPYNTPPPGTNNCPYQYVVVSNAPTFSGTNVTILGWIWPNYNSAGLEAGGNAGILMQRSSVFGATQTDGIQYANSSNNIGYHWDNDTSATYNYNAGPAIPNQSWSLIALVISPSNTVFYVCNTNTGIATNMTTLAHTAQAWGSGMEIGADLYNNPGRTFQGLLSSWAMFPSSLTASNIETLFNAGVALGAPVITTEPAPVTVNPGGAAAVFTVNAISPITLYYQWEAGAVGSGVYTNLSNSGNISGATSPTLTITDPGEGNQAEYIVVIMDSAGHVVASYPVTLTALSLSTVTWEEAGQGGIVTAVAASPDGNWIASGSDDATAKIWRTSDHGLQCTLAATGLHHVTSLAFGPVGTNIIAAGYYDGSIRLWNTTNGALVRTFTPCSGKVTSMAFSPSGQQLAIGSGDWLTRIMSLSSGTVLTNTNVSVNTTNGTVYNYGVVRSVAYSPNGSLLAVAGEDTNWYKTIYVLNGTTWAVVANLIQGSNVPPPAAGPYSTPISNSVTSLAFSPDGATLASGCLDQTICFWSTANWALQSTVTNSTGQGITSLAYDPNGQTLFAGDQGGVITPWTVSTGLSAYPSWPAHTGPVWSLACSVDGAKLVSGGDDHIVQLWQTANGAWVTNLTSHTAMATKTCFAPDGSLVASAGNDASLRLWEAQTGAPGYVLLPHTNQVSALAFSPDATFLVSGGGCSDNDICLWSCSNGTLLQDTPILTIPSLFTNGVTALAVSPDTRLIASAGDRYEQIIRIWNRFTDSLSYTFAGHANGTSVLAFSPTGRYLASGGMFYSGAINLWDLTNNNLAFSFNGHTCTVVSISFNPTGTLLASAGQNDGQVCVWTNGGVATPIWSNIMSAGARAVAFSPDGTLLVAGGSDSIQMWLTSDLWEGPVWTCTTETVGINSLGFSPNGTFLTFGREDGTVGRMWNPAAAPVQLWLGATQAGRFTIANPSYSPFLTVQTSSNLSQWNTLTNLVAATNLVQVTDPAPPPKGRFYRVATPE